MVAGEKLWEIERSWAAISHNRDISDNSSFEFIIEDPEILALSGKRNVRLPFTEAIEPANPAIFTTSSPLSLVVDLFSRGGPSWISWLVVAVIIRVSIERIFFTWAWTKVL